MQKIVRQAEPLESHHWLATSEDATPKTSPDSASFVDSLVAAGLVDEAGLTRALLLKGAPSPCTCC